MAAAIASLQPPPPFSVDLDGATNATRWGVWWRKFENFCQAATIKDDDIKYATLLNLAGDAIDAIVQAIAKDKQKASEVNTALMAHFDLEKNTDKLIIRFRNSRTAII